MKPKKWIIGECLGTKDEILKISTQLNISELTAQLLYNRGYTTPEKAYSFLTLDSETFYNPFLLNDMDLACNRILKAIDDKEKITIYGDYDVDGITSVCVLFLYLKSLNANVSFYIPERSTGYGVNSEAIKNIFNDGTSLIITVDTGITAIDEIAESTLNGCDFVVTDHHECRDVLPNCCAVVNPRRKNSQYPYDSLAGVGVVFKLVCALEFTYRKQIKQLTNGFIERICDLYIDLVAIGTIADVMPLSDENRLIVSLGLSKLNKHRRPGLDALFDIADKGSGKKNINTTVIGYNIAPRLNAAGRMDSATRSVDLLLTDSKDEAEEISEFLDLINTKRREEENSIVADIERMIIDSPEIAENKVIVIGSDYWHHGVIGVAASRVVEKYGRPTILITFEDGVGKGSGRSIDGFNLSEALAKCSDLLLNYGGHELAAGIKISKDKLDDFIKRINSVAQDEVEQSYISVYSDFLVSPSEITLAQATELSLLEPFGYGNPVPVFACKDMTIDNIIPISNNNHTKYILRYGNKSFTALHFGMNYSNNSFIVGDKCDILFNLSVNTFMGRSSEQIIIREIMPSSSELKKASNEYNRYKMILDGTSSCNENDIPTRNDFVNTYKILRDIKNRISIHEISNRENMRGYVVTRLSLDILEQAGLITSKEVNTSVNGFEIYEFKLNNKAEKAILEETCIYKQIKSQLNTQK